MMLLTNKADEQWPLQTLCVYQ